ncbi:hypothetical protein [Microbacterium trichothecenolyticum]|uniref:Uncharacterized protein n=1 Tax=Microbacterium trichothecenolyticum TaxID=69370 RepID=A0ABU0TQV6_MICTR|nr:hypothetical protein [Microbacterium trichothecenolyticum]MDQ1121830.1 hypothetical protein [Microbacterium trichothecenolyticum]
MSRKRRSIRSRAPRITHLYGRALKWTKVTSRARLTPETARELRSEGFTMALVRTGWRGTRRISLIRYVQSLGPAEGAPVLMRASGDIRRAAEPLKQVAEVAGVTLREP